MENTALEPCTWTEEGEPERLAAARWVSAPPPGRAEEAAPGPVPLHQEVIDRVQAAYKDANNAARLPLEPCPACVHGGGWPEDSPCPMCNTTIHAKAPIFAVVIFEEILAERGLIGPVSAKNIVNDCKRTIAWSHKPEVIGWYKRRGRNAAKVLGIEFQVGGRL